MIDFLLHDFIFNLILFQVALLAVILSNLTLLHRSRRHAPPEQFPKVSILVPAFNEEKNVGRCIQSLLAQDYPSFEVFALDDQSTDATLAVLEQLAISQPKLKILRGSPPPADQMGKNWACSQLAGHAEGDLLFFTDADTFHQPKALRVIVTTLLGERADLLTGFPQQHVLSWGERLLVPFFSWASLSFIPLWIAYKVRWQFLVVAVGQVMLFQREAYQKIGGHAALGGAIVDDITLARKIKAAGLRWRVTSISDLIKSRMYHSSAEAANGFTKNLFAAFDFHLISYLFVFLWLAVLFVLPILLLGSLVAGTATNGYSERLIICVILSFFVWLIPYIEIGIPLYLTFLFPVTVLANEVIAFRSLFFSLTGRLTWKNRPLNTPKWKWL